MVYTFVASITVACYIWGFREDWGVSGSQFILTWMVFWLYMHINFVIVDTMTAFVPAKFFAFFLLTWIIINVTSTIYPFELSPGFYRWGYALPAHEIYSLLVQVWSGGCNNQAYRALPILFAWEVVGMVSATVGMFYRNSKARKEISGLEAKGDTDALHGIQRGPWEEIEEAEELARIEAGGAGPSFPLSFLPSDKR
ncbi:hypothetical protein B0O99DRAFT_638158 [Bisporella sp. PMI_857]|nr:hypothetical protein B0O99DRAFT_638158 [Bisporella sp. PMI_857]